MEWVVFATLVLGYGVSITSGLVTLYKKTEPIGSVHRHDHRRSDQMNRARALTELFAEIDQFIAEHQKHQSSNVNWKQDGF